MAAGADLLGGRDDRPLRLRQAGPSKGGKGPSCRTAGQSRCLVTGKQAPRRPGPDGRSSPLVRAGSAAHRKPLVPGGHQRVTTGMQACGTTHLHGQRPRPLQEPDGGFEPSPQQLPWACGPCQRGKWSPWTGFNLRLSLWPSPRHRTRFVLAGLALRVPVVSVPDGPIRTTAVGRDKRLSCVIGEAFAWSECPDAPLVTVAPHEWPSSTLEATVATLKA